MDRDEPVTTQPAWSRKVLYAAVRAVVVLLAAAVAFPAVVPYTRTARSRLAQMVPEQTGIAVYDKAKRQSGEQADGSTGLAAVTAAAKSSPDRTGIYSAEWSPAQTSGAGVIVFLLPSPAAARTALGQVEAQQLARGSYTTDQLNRAATFTVAGVPGSSGSAYHPSSAAGPPGLAVTAFQYGRVVAVSEVANRDLSAVQSDTEKLTRTEYARLQALGTGFTLQVKETPALPTIAWGAGAVLLAALVALLPLERYRRALKRQRAYEEEMANKVVVGRQVIAKRRR